MSRGFPPEGIGPTLALINACLNFTQFVLLTLAYRAIKAGNRVKHRKLMITAVCVAVTFLCSYVTRMSLMGSMPYPGGGWPRTFYLGLLTCHTLMAMTLVYFVPRTVFLAVKDRQAEHKKIARRTFPIWIFVSITGVIVYLMLYQLPVLPRDGETATSDHRTAVTARN